MLPFRSISASCVFALALILSCTVTVAQDPSWRTIGQLNLDRHHAHLRYLGDYQVLVIGGWSRSTGILSGIPTSTCEIIDVRRETISEGPSMNVERVAFQVVDAPDGSFYAIAGGTSSVERFDRLTGTWEVVGSLTFERHQHAAAFVSPDEIMVVGGFGSRSAEIFNVRTGQSRPVADFPYVANSLSVVEVEDRRPAFYGGRESGPNTGVSQLAYAYDFDQDRWEAVYDLGEVAIRPTTIKLPSGQALVVAGVRSESPFTTFRTVRMVAPNGNVTLLDPLQQGRQWHGLGLWSKGRVLCAAGTVDGPFPANTCEFIDPASATVTQGPTLNSAHSFAPMITFREGRTFYALVVSGLGNGWSGNPDVELLVEGCADVVTPMEREAAELVGNALRAGSEVQLTPPQEFSRGAVWAREKVNMRAPFSTMFAFKITQGDDQGEVEPVPSDPGADGVVLVIQNQGADVIGNYGRGIGYDGIKRSIAVEFDTYHNPPINDPNGNHVAIQSRGRAENTSMHGTGATLAFSSTVMPISADGTVYYAYVTYQQGRMDVYLNTSPSFRAPVVSKYVDLDSLIGLDPNGAAWVGITSGTGRSFEQHDLVMWEINGCAEDSPVSVQDGPEPVTGRVRDFAIVGDEVRLAAGAEGDRYVIDVIDVRGTVIWSTAANASVVALPSASIGNGWYLVRVSSSTGSSVQTWVVVR